MKKLFIAAMALATIVSCSKDDAGDVVLESSKKAISITIANGVSTGTRAVAEVQPTPGGGVGDVVSPEDNQVAAKTSELTVLFANSAGNVIEAYTFADAATTTEANPANNTKGVYTYTYHAVHESVTQVAVVRYAAYQITDESNPFVGKNLSFFAEAAAVEDLVVDLDAIELYGASNIALDEENPVCKVAKTEKDGHVTEYQYALYTATVDVIPALARVEIEGISCEDLGTQTTAADTDPTKTGGYDELALTSIVWGATDAQYTYAFEATDVLYGIHEEDHTARDLVSYVPGENDDMVIAWNVAPTAAVPSNDAPMVLTMQADAYDYTVNNATKTLSIVGFEEGITAFERSKIYRMNINFNEENLDESNEAICVNVEVKVANWVVEEITPEFKN